VFVYDEVVLEPEFGLGLPTGGSGVQPFGSGNPNRTIRQRTRRVKTRRLGRAAHQRPVAEGKREIGNADQYEEQHGAGERLSAITRHEARTSSGYNSDVRKRDKARSHVKGSRTIVTFFPSAIERAW
jgi:hypothetical protein